MIFNEIRKFDIKKLADRRQLSFLFFLFFTFLLLLLNLFVGFSVDKIIAYIAIIWMPFLLFLKSSNEGINVSSFFKFHIILALFGALGGIIEFHISRDIFGLVPKVGYLELYDNFSVFYRTRSIFYSTQINALFQAISFIILLQFRIFENKLFKGLILCIILYSLLLTGSRTAIIIPILFLLFKYPIKSITYLAPIAFISASLILANPSSLIYESIIRQFDIILNFNEFLFNESNLRFAKQFMILENSNLILGNGIGSTYSGSAEYLNSESYYLQMYSEFGIIGVFLLLIFFSTSYYLAKPKLKHIISVMALTGLFVHGLSSPYLLIFWVILFNNEDTI